MSSSSGRTYAVAAGLWCAAMALSVLQLVLVVAGREASTPLGVLIGVLFLAAVGATAARLRRDRRPT